MFLVNIILVCSPMLCNISHISSPFTVFLNNISSDSFSIDNCSLSSSISFGEWFWTVNYNTNTSRSIFQKSPPTLCCSSNICYFTSTSTRKKCANNYWSLLQLLCDLKIHVWVAHKGKTTWSKELIKKCSCISLFQIHIRVKHVLANHPGDVQLKSVSQRGNESQSQLELCLEIEMALHSSQLSMQGNVTTTKGGME